MDVNSNKYTYIFSVSMVVIVAALLSIASTTLKPYQDKNVELEKKSDILRSIGVEGEDVEALFDEHIKEQLVIQNGVEVEAEEGAAFKIDMAEAVDMDADKRQVPLYVAEVDQKTYYILPLRGKGLWGPIWGYVAVEGDGNTVYGATFGHKTETPGLGAEIATPFFQDKFPGKKLFSANYDGIQVRKGDASGDQQVDGISGGTITSVGVQDMIQDCLKAYKPYLLKKNANTVIDSEGQNNDTMDETLTTASL
jgi:Na+-transporting NADH:ubiquinone oxidoreductase subunit C